MKIYTCCPKEDCQCFQNALQFLKSFGIEPKIKCDDHHYFSFKIPKKWTLAKRKRFNGKLKDKSNFSEEVFCSSCNAFQEQSYHTFSCKICKTKTYLCDWCLQNNHFVVKCDCNEKEDNTENLSIFD